MLLKDIRIDNFHCFSSEKFDLARQTTVFIGKNGTGKSSLIKAVRCALSFMFNKSNSNTWGFPSLANEVTDLGVENISVRDIRHDGIIADYVAIEATASLMDGNEETAQCISWIFKKQAYEKAQVQNSQYKEAYIQLRQNMNTTGMYPLLVYYSDRYPHVNTNLGKNVKTLLNEDEHISRAWGYYHWNEFTSCADIWQKRFIRINNQSLLVERQLREVQGGSIKEVLLEKLNRYEKEIQYVSQFLKVFTDNQLQGLSDTSDGFKVISVTVDGATDFSVKFVFADGMERRWYELPAGLERLFSIVFDMAYRSYILNGVQNRPQGIVMIDELDLHLHPSLQQDVLIRLRAAFPDVQFIIATHSPLIATNFRQDNCNKVVRMTREGKNYSHTDMGSLFALDYSYMLSEVMQTAPRNLVVSQICERYIRLRLRGKDDKADVVLTLLEDLVGKDAFPRIKQSLEDEIAQG